MQEKSDNESLKENFYIIIITIYYVSGMSPHNPSIMLKLPKKGPKWLSVKEQKSKLKTNLYFWKFISIRIRNCDPFIWKKKYLWQRGLSDIALSHDI